MFLIIGLITFVFWLLFPLVPEQIIPIKLSTDEMRRQALLSLYRSSTFLDRINDVVKLMYGTWYQILSFLIALGCGLGFFLFKDDKKGIDNY
jgi:uncharacterized membrane protein